MSSTHHLDSRLPEDFDVQSYLFAIVKQFGLGLYVEHRAIVSGFEDYNIQLSTDRGDWFVKIFHKQRSEAEVRRAVQVISEALRVGVVTPRLQEDIHDDSVFTSEGVFAIVTEFIHGETYYDTRLPVSNEELSEIMKSVVRLHASTKPIEYQFDAWSIQNIEWMYQQVQGRLEPYDSLIRGVIDEFNAVDVGDLSSTLVHGDIIQSNIICAEHDIYVIDFSVANIAPKIQELAVMAANLLGNSKEGLAVRCERLVSEYQNNGGELTPFDVSALMPYAKAALVMEYMGSLYAEEDASTEEVLYWRQQAVRTFDSL